MNLSHKSLASALLISLTLFLTAPILYPSLRLFYLVPFLVIMFYQKPYMACLWASFLCGMLMDLAGSHTRFGLYALNYTLTTLILYERRRHFFGDSLTTLPLMVFFFSSLSTFIQAPLVYIFDREILMSWRWVLADGFLLPVVDGLYAFLIWVLPPLLFGKRPRAGREYFAN